MNAEGFSPIKKKVEVIQRFPQPQKQKQLLAFLGSLNYYRASLPKSQPTSSHPRPQSPAEILDPLYKLATSKEVKNFKKAWHENPIYEEAFKDAKELLVNAVQLNYPVPNAPLAKILSIS